MIEVTTADSLVFAEGAWREGNPALLGVHSQSTWLGSTVFDGARYFDGSAPDLALHCERAVRSAKIMGLEPMVTGEEIAEIAWHGIAKFGPGKDLYIKPVFWAEGGFLTPDPETTKFALNIFVAELPEPKGFSACLSSFRRPARDMAPTDAKAACLYANVSRAVREAAAKGFDTGVKLDPSGNVAEFAYNNLFMAKDGQVHTPAHNGTFLNGITRQRVIRLLRDSGTEVIERAISFQELMEADEIFATGNFAKVTPCTRLNERTLTPGEAYKKARSLYWEFARASNG